MNKNLNLIYFSATDTTKKILKQIASSMVENYKEYDITLDNDRNTNLSFNSDDVVMVGVPVYAGRVPKFLIDYFKRIKGSNTLAIFVVLYGNRAYEDALLELKDTFEANSFLGIAAGAFIGEHSYTKEVANKRPDANDLEIANVFGVDILNKIKNQNLNLINSKLDVKGNYPYKERKNSPKVAPTTSDACIDCGICAKHCPMGAINLKNFKEIDADKCIKCCSCVKKCPVEAKYMDNEFVNKLTKMLIDNCSLNRNEPELFI